ncbi:alpha/beta fold hydrolase [Dyella flava]|uniref:Alpha/beta hydrolase n=1 Tax=Dyella flava TaxID=1920170 RepID=A0ABS2K1D8_9GAMM|nr:alpha/beta hydrolase [Dyella flava]MBM7125062.1 alpha/beta hydrolase [Dyella flava]GLQ51935.1 arylesterase [Dyella flava]
MSMLEVETDMLGRPVELYYEDVGYGFPVVLTNGWLLDHNMWEHQVADLLDKGCRVITYDRRGFGQSSQSQGSYNYNRFADDLALLLQGLDLNDVTLVGYSMGVGEVVRYMARHLGQRVGRLALVSGVAPSLVRSPTNPDGVDESVLEKMEADIRDDRYEFSSWFADQLFEGDGEPAVSDATKRWIQAQTRHVSTEGMLAGIQLCRETDFTEELRAIINIPSLVVHGSNDHLAPIAATGDRLAKALPDSVYRVYDDAPHGLFVTHAQELSSDLVELVKTPPNVTLPAARV